MSSRPSSPPPVSELLFIQAFGGLGDAFACVVRPEGLPTPRLRLVSLDAARLLGIEPTPNNSAAAQNWAELFSGNRPPTGCDPICTVYAGHQFGNWAGQLGDGRAHLLGTVRAPDASQNGGHTHWEVQLKGAGRTPYSRHGDGRAVLRSSIREFLCSEAMWHLGIPTTRALCLVTSPLPVVRERMETAAVVTRLAPSFIRFGHFEHFAYTGQVTALRTLADWTISQLYPACAQTVNPALALLQEVVQRTAHLIAQWQCVGFIHGVMNTDNMSMLAWTLDYGPFAFMDGFDPDHTPNTTDRFGRYAWARQPSIARWNLLALAQALLPLIDDRQAAVDAVEAFDATFSRSMRGLLQRKLGLGEARPGDDDLVDRWLAAMAENRADWTLAFRLLAQLSANPGDPIPAALQALFATRPERMRAWIPDYRARLQANESTDAERRAAMNAINPRFVLRHHLAQHAIARAEAGDFSVTQELMEVLRHPYSEQPDRDIFAAAPPQDAVAPALSCSS
ncbi:YdiU family protein [Thiomonas sp. FB-Cd]|uniref:protein adenylyltransferase SelO n=1 Tax=Thiomonas sp. FB-Cd TaxID=1158292 RepID=UPI0004DFAA1E|nr:YdiU family protein [Thiomonas sp. FB-Cd]